MDQIIHYIAIPFGYLMKWCYMLTSNFGLAIILFTLATKIVLLPLSIWIQKNSILMVKIQPEVNFLKANFHGNMDAIAEGQAKIFKKAKYHPMLSIIPLVLQLIILLAVVEIIYHPMGYIFGFSNTDALTIAEYLNIATNKSSYELEVISQIKNNVQIPSEIVANLDLYIEKANGIDLKFLGLDLSKIATQAWGLYLLAPILAGASSFFLCWTQNLANVLQKEQSKWNQYGIMGISVALSLYLGFFVPSGIALYWIFSNAFSILQMYLLNIAINPKKYVDYEELEKSRKALADAKAFGAEDKHSANYKENKKREKVDYKKFKNIVNKHIVFYSERSGFYKYYKDLIEELLVKSNVTIHYVTNDPDDVIFEIAKTQPRVKPYFISLKKTAMLMMMVEADIFVMTTPDLNKYYLKKSLLKKDIEYIYIPHDAMSVSMSFNEGAFDAFDTVFCAGPHIKKELTKINEIRKIENQNLVEFGFPFMDYLAKQAAEESANSKPTEKKEILIAPSWQEDNILDSVCLDIINSFKEKNVHLTIRPHPEYVKRFSAKLNNLIENCREFDESFVSFETDFSKNKSIYSSDLIITDWSGVGPEFAFGTNKPAIFIDTKMKCNNPNYEIVGLTPVEISLRNEIGVSISKEEVKDINKVAERLFKEKDKYSKIISKRFETFIYNHNSSALSGAKYILKSLYDKQMKRKEGK